MLITPTNLNSQKLLITTIAQFFMKYRHPAILCVGNSKVIGDAFAPILGEQLLEKHLPVHIYGRKGKNILSSNLDSYIAMAKEHHDGILVIDSTFSTADHIGTLSINPYGCVVDCLHHPTKVGDYSILGNINTFSLTSLTQLTKTKKEMVAHLVTFTANSIAKGYELSKTYKSLLF